MRTILKRAAVAALAVGVALAPQAAFAQSTNLLTVDIGRLYSDSAAGKSGTAQIRAKYEGQLQTANNAFNSAATAYNTQVEAARKTAKPDGALLPATQQSLGRAQQTVQQADQNLSRLQEEVNAVGGYVQRQILERAVPITEQIRAQRKADAVVPRGSVLAADPATDITTAVITSLDTSLKTVSIVLPQQGAAPARGANTQGR